MAVHRLVPGPVADYDDSSFGPLSGFQSIGGSFVVNPPADPCIALAGSGSISRVTDPANDTALVVVGWADDSVIPPGATINSVRFGMRFQGVGIQTAFDSGLPGAKFNCNIQNFSGGSDFAINTPAANAPNFVVCDSPGLTEYFSATMTLNPLTGLPWTTNDIFTSETEYYTAPSFITVWSMNLFNDTADPSLLWDLVFLEVDYVGSTSEASINQLPIEIAYPVGVLVPLLSGRTELLVPAAHNTVSVTVKKGAGIRVGGSYTIGICTGSVTSVNGNTIGITALCADQPADEPFFWDNDPRGWRPLAIGRGQCECCADPLTTTVTGEVGTGAPMSTVLYGLINAAVQFFDADGVPIANGSIEFFAAGTTTPLPVYADAGGTTPLSNPLDLDDEGRATFYMGPAVYKIDVKDADGVSLDGYPVDNIAGSVFPGRLAGAVTISPAANASQNGHQLQATINKAATGTHALFTGLQVLTPTIGVGGAALSEATTLYVQGAPSVGSVVYAFHVAAGIARFDGSISLKPVTFAQLPSGPTKGQMAVVTDSNTNTWGANIAGGGANSVLAFYNGSAWTVAAK